MKIAFFSYHSYDKKFFEQENSKEFELHFYRNPLDLDSLKLAEGCDAVCVFVNDDVNKEVLDGLKEMGVKHIALRCAGFNNVDTDYAKEIGINVCRVPQYSPNAVAEFSLALIMTLNRKTHRSYMRIREDDFRLSGLLGFDIFGSTVGVIGTGAIGAKFCKIMLGLGCKVMAYDVKENEELLGLENFSYASLDDIYAQSDIISLHCPLFPSTKHIINKDSIAKMKDGVMIVNTSRGALIHTGDVIEGLKSKKIGYLGLDVYEYEKSIFFKDLSDTIIEDDAFARLQTFSNVVITGHQAFFTETALTNIAKTTYDNLHKLSLGEECLNLV
ncbi:MAG: 2-hydroxyacid dehydrogenase [Alphaproteobacteria bacterium]|jgi:D-lactate dehydrogenase|nr:2-hydroxyacid dehydrogenase [Alphaproteobacteria bacterium]MCV6599873.1 2-hydroxyacid dehydrogenase [Alphaproteobacteria bacterium]